MFIDMHSHVAWNIDDGMDTKEHAIQAIKKARADGILKIIATPHFIPGRHSLKDKEEMGNRIEELKELSNPFGLEVYTGCEIFMNIDYMKMIQDKAFFTLNDSKYVLVEFDVRKDIKNNQNVEDMLYELEIRNYTPVIAHVERYFHSNLDVDRIKRWIDSGYIIQVNRTSILGMQGSQNETNAMKLLKIGYVHLVASDAHSSEGTRICKLSDAYEKIKKISGESNAKLLCSENPMRILENEEIQPMIIRSGFVKRLFGRGV